MPRMGDTLDTPRPVPSLKAGVGWVAGAVRHAGWWLDWQTRIRPGQGSRTARRGPGARAGPPAGSLTAGV